MEWLECSACKQQFTTTSNFDFHRVGEFKDEHPDYGRRCLSPDEMYILGMKQNNQGAWYGFESATKRVIRSSDQQDCDPV